MRELGAEIAHDYEGREPLLVGTLKGCIPFLCDLSRAVPIHHELDFIELAAVIGHPDTKRPGNDIVNLYVQLKPHAKERSAEELRESILQFCRDNMAAYKIPKQVHFLDALPLTPVGKLDKKALRR